MSASKIASRYSKALVGLCEKDKSHEHIARDLDKVVHALDGAKDVEAALVDPSVDPKVKGEVLKSISKSLVLRPLTQNFLLFVNDKGRLSALRDITSDFHERLDTLAGRIRAHVVAARPLTTLEKQRIKAALEKASGKSVVLEDSVDQALIGGVVTRIGNTVLDGSVRTALDKMKTQLTEAVQ